MYTTDEAYQQQQRDNAQKTIGRIAECYVSHTRRIQELDWWRSIYQAYGNWQTAIDLLEEQMRVWGRQEQEENRDLMDYFDGVLKQQTVSAEKGRWEEHDYYLLGKAQAYSDTRYAVRFLSLGEALRALEQRGQTILNGLDSPSCSEFDALKGRATAAELSRVIDYLKMISVEGTIHRWFGKEENDGEQTRSID